jgi:iron complex transport system permease protein
MNRERLILPVCLAVLAAAALASLTAGRAPLDPAQVLHALVSPNGDLASLVVLELRLPRAVLAILVGGALGLSGAALQGLLRNPLAEPGLLGVSGGAALGAVVAIYFGLSSAFPLAAPVLGIAGALAAGALTFALGRGGGTLTLILAGAAVSSLAGAGVALALNLAPSLYAIYEITLWLLGSLTDRSWEHVLLSAPFILAGGALLALLGRALDALTLGEAQARSLGVDLDRTRLLALVGTALAVGAATAVTGAIGFIGLVAPHLVRPFVGARPSRVLAPSAVLGAALLLAADVAVRLIQLTSEIRLGVLTSLIGAPFFIWLVLRLKRTAP